MDTQLLNTLTIDTVLKATQYVKSLQTRVQYNIFNGKKAYADIRNDVLDCTNITDCLVVTSTLATIDVSADDIRSIRSLAMLRTELDRLETALDIVKLALEKRVQSELQVQEQSIIDSCVQDAVEGNKAPLAHTQPLFDAYRSVPVSKDVEEGYYKLHWMENTQVVLVTMPWCSARLLVQLALDNTTGFYNLMVRTVLSDGSLRELQVASIQQQYKPMLDCSIHVFRQNMHSASYKSLRSTVYHLVRSNGKFEYEWNDIVYYMFNGKMPSTTTD